MADAFLAPHLAEHKQPSATLVQQRTRLENLIAMLIEIADEIDGDCDFETFNPDLEPDVDIEIDAGDYDEPGYIWGGQGE